MNVHLLNPLHHLKYAILIATISSSSSDSVASINMTRSFEIDFENDCFRKDGDPFRVISGGMHYFRIPEGYWLDRLRKARVLGLNTVETYIAWNLHEPKQGEYVFDGSAPDLLRYLRMAQEEDLLVILRPGPYIDAEWEHGGFPWWMAKNASMEMRSGKSEQYIQAVHTWLKVLCGKIQPYLYKNGGAVIALQVENEYGNWIDCDHEYMRSLEILYQTELGNDVVLFTVDGYKADEMKCGSIPSLFATVDFGTEIDPIVPFNYQRKYQKRGPLVNMEFYVGWLDYWKQTHERTSAIKVAEHLDKILAIPNASVNLYMLHGGTNFGFMNGADIDEGKFKPVPTSYDYDAPLSEAGDPTDKYYAIRDILKKYVDLPGGPVPPATQKGAFGTHMLSQRMDIQTLVKLVSLNVVHSLRPLSMEDIDQDYGFLLYKTTLGDTDNRRTLRVSALSDFAVVILDGVVQGTLDRNGQKELEIGTGTELHILVENQGRLCYAPTPMDYLPDPKGILGNVTLDDSEVLEWQMLPIVDQVLKNAVKICEQSEEDSVEKTDPVVPSFYTTSFQLSTISDTFIRMNGLHKGQLYVNGENMGRYWPAAKSPQLTLFVPKFALREGRNHVTLFEVGAAEVDSQPSITFLDAPIFT